MHVYNNPIKKPTLNKVAKNMKIALPRKYF